MTSKRDSATDSTKGKRLTMHGDGTRTERAIPNDASPKCDAINHRALAGFNKFNYCPFCGLAIGRQARHLLGAVSEYLDALSNSRVHKGGKERLQMAEESLGLALEEAQCISSR